MSNKATKEKSEEKSEIPQEVAEAAQQAVSENKLDEVESLRKQLAEMQDRMLRVAADAENAKEELLKKWKMLINMAQQALLKI